MSFFDYSKRMLAMRSRIDDCRSPLDRRTFLRRSAAGVAAGALLSLSVRVESAPAPGQGGFLVLDDCDPNYKGKDDYQDNLTCFDAAGRMLFRVSGLNNCQEIGTPHKIAVDTKRKKIWHTENVGHRLLQYDMTGKELLALSGVRASSLALDPASGNIWVARSSGTIHGDSVDVYDEDGKQIANYTPGGWDIAYDGKAKAFWLAGRSLIKTTLEGEVVFQKQVTAWCCSSIAVDQKTGTVWLTPRMHPQVPGSSNELLAFDNSGKELYSVGLGGQDPFRVAVDSSDGSVWVTMLRGSIVCYSAKGQLEEEIKIPGLAADVEAGTGNVWIATEEEVLKVDRKGKVLVKAKHKGKTSQAWVASF
jgi:sugar lactone lactonase YvrE